MKHQPNYKQEFEDISGVKDISQVVKQRRKWMDIALRDMQNNDVLKDLVSYTLPKYGQRDHGVLKEMNLRLNEFYDKFLMEDRESFFDGEAHLKELSSIFAQTMDTLVKKWPTLAKAGHDWNKVCDAISQTMRMVSGSFGLSAEMNTIVNDWFDNYRRSQGTEIKYNEREKLNNEAIRAHSELAYFATVGADRAVMEQVRSRIVAIDKRLGKLPVDPRPENVPAFSRVDPMRQRKVIVAQPEIENDDEKTVITRRAEVPGKGGWMKKIPFFGRFF